MSIIADSPRRSRLASLRFAVGERIFAQGEGGDTAFIVRKGRVRLIQILDGHRMDIGSVGPGEIFGEMAVLDGGRRSATATAEEDCVLARVPQAVFQHKLDGADRFLKGLIEMFIKNIRTSPRLFLRRPRSFRDHVRQMGMFSWNMRRFAGRLDDPAMADDVLDILDRLDAVLDDLANVAELTADKRLDLVADTELAGVDFADVIGSNGRRRL
ncbi:MAG: cyclic nucleotide-binding domain-containing protein [Magnetospirillum sp.]|nr:cyclic nucleotide-binding domain-containing protein [Magnetospirillum sp.]